MRRLACFLTRLYPGSWQARYGDEVHALLEDLPPGWRTVFDLLKGAIRMQLANLSFAKMALALSMAGLAAGLGASFLVTPRYSSSAELIIMAGRFDAPVPPHRNLPEYFLQMKNEILSRTSLSRFIQDPRLDLYKADRRVMPLEDVIEAMRQRDLRIDPVPHAGITTNDSFAFTIGFDYSDPHKAQAAVQRVVTAFADNNQSRQREAATAQQTFESDEISRFDARLSAIERKLGIIPADVKPLRFIDTFQKRPPFNSQINVEVLDPPTLPELPAFPNRKFFAAAGSCIGLALAAVIALVRRRVPPVIPLAA